MKSKKKKATIYPLENAKRKSTKRAFLAMLLSVTLLLSSCSDGVFGIFDSVLNNSNYRNRSGSKVIEKENLVLLLISCISNLSEIRNVYEEIPNAQLDGMSFAEFDEYIHALNDMVNRPVAYYRFLSSEDRQRVLQPIIEGAADQEALIRQTTPVELHMRNNDEVRYLYIQEHDDGMAYLSREWVRACAFIYKYAELYFHALDTQNQAATESLLKLAIVPETDGEISSLVIDYKAKGLIEYYQRQVRERFDSYQIESFDLSQLTFTQPRFLDETTGEYVPRNVRFVRKTPTLIAVKDTVTSPLDSRDFELHKDGRSLHIFIGGWIDMNSLDQLIGEEPLIVSSEMDSTEVDGMKTIVVSYKSLTITLRAAATDDEGNLLMTRISRIRLRGVDSGFSLGPGIENGMAVDSLLRLYPFADLENYVIDLRQDETDYRMFLTIDPTDGGHVTEVNLEASLKKSES